MNKLRTLLAALLLATLLAPTVAMAQLTIGRQPQANGKRAIRQPADQGIAVGQTRLSKPMPKAQQMSEAGPTAGNPGQIMKLLEELDQAYANHAMLMQNVLTQVPPAARIDIQSAIQSAEQNRRVIAVRRKQLAQTNPGLNTLRNSPTATGSPVPKPATRVNSEMGVAKPGLQKKREARQKAAIKYQQEMKKNPIRRAKPGVTSEY